MKNFKFFLLKKKIIEVFVFLWLNLLFLYICLLYVYMLIFFLLNFFLSDRVDGGGELVNYM